MTISIYSGVTASGGSGSGSSYKYTTGTTYTGLVATRCKAATAGNQGVLQHMARSIHVARTNITQIGVAVANWYVSSTYEFSGGADCTVKVSIEYPLGGTIYPLTFGGNATGLVYNLTTLMSDLANVNIPNGATFAVREYRVCNSGGSPVCNGGSENMFLDQTNGECYAQGNSLSDLTGVPGTFANTGNMITLAFYRPVAIFGPTTVPSYALCGASATEGYMDQYNGSWDCGLVARTIGPIRAYTNLGRGGETIQNVTDTGNFSLRAQIVKAFCTHMTCDYGANDFIAGANAQNTLARLLKFRAMFPEKYFYYVTSCPDTTSTDGWTTVVNQTVETGASERVEYNNYVRANTSWAGSNFDGVYDTTPITESSINSSKWVPGLTTDGDHPTPAGYAAIAASGIIKVM